MSDVVVKYGVNGASRTKHKLCDNLSQANRFAARWRCSNSTDDYWAVVYKFNRKTHSWQELAS